MSATRLIAGSLLLLLATAEICNELTGCSLSQVQNASFVLLSTTPAVDYTDIKIFNKTTYGLDLFCSPLWGGTLVGACVTTAGELCATNCSLTSNYLYTCQTITNTTGYCDMDKCANSSASVINSFQTSPCTEMCNQVPCNGGSKYCNNTFLYSYYNVTNGTIYGNASKPLLSPVPFTGCSNTSQCFCRVGSYISTVQAIRNYSIHTYTYLSFQTCTDEITNDKVSVTCPSGNYTLQLLINSALVYNSVFSTTIDLSLPPGLHPNSAIEIFVLKNMIVFFTDTLYSTDTGACREQHCYICSDFFDQWDCQDTLSKVISILLLFIIAFFSYIFLCLLLPPFLIYTKMLISFLLSFFKKVSRALFRKPTLPIYEKTLDSSGSQEMKTIKVTSRKSRDFDDIDLSPSNSRSSKIGSQTKQALFFTVLCLAVPCKSACTDNPTVISSFPVCSYNGSVSNCSLSFNIQQSLPYINATSCYILKDGNNILGDLQLKYIRQYTVSFGKFIYYTSSFTGRIESHNGCDEDSWCHSRCNSISATDTTGLGQMHQPWRFCQGISRCTRGPGCASNGCWSCGAKCYISRAVLDTSSYFPYSVYNFDSHSHTFELSYTITIGNTTTTKLFNISYLNSPIDSNFNIQLTGAFTPMYEVNRPSIAATYSCFFGCSAPKYGPYSQINSPQKGTIGELQTSSISALGCPSDSSAVTNIIWDSSIYTPSGNSAGSFSQPSLNIMNTFPLVYAGNSWDFRLPNILYTYPSIVNPLLVNLQTKIPMTIVKNVSVVCPKGSVLNSTGFYKSTKGFSVFLNLSSSCSSGEVEVSSFNCTTTFFVLTTGFEIYTLHCYSEDPQISGEILIKSTVQSLTLTYLANLNFTTDVVPNNDSLVVFSSNKTGSTNWGSLGNFFSKGVFGFSTGLSSLFNKILNVFIYVILALLAVVVLFYISKFVFNMLSKVKTS